MRQQTKARNKSRALLASFFPQAHTAEGQWLSAPAPPAEPFLHFKSCRRFDQAARKFRRLIADHRYLYRGVPEERRCRVSSKRGIIPLLAFVFKGREVLYVVSCKAGGFGLFAGDASMLEAWEAESKMLDALKAERTRNRKEAGRILAEAGWSAVRIGNTLR